MVLWLRNFITCPPKFSWKILAGGLVFLITLGGVFVFSFGGFLLASEVSITATVAYTQETHQIDTTQIFSESLVNPNSTQLDVSFPVDSLTSGEAVEMTFYSTAESVVVSENPLPSGKLAANTFYNFSFTKVSDNSAVSSFDKAVVLTFYYTDSDISGINESTLTAYRWNGSSWVALSDSAINTSLNTVTASSQQFSFFALLGSAPASCGDGSCNGSETCSSCAADCGNCSTSSSGGGGGGGGPAPATQVVIQGIAYPLAKITVLKDGQVLASGVLTDAQANFKIALTTVTAGTYTFGVWAEDKEGRKSITFSFTVTVSANMTTTIGGIFIPPTIELDKVNLSRGEALKIAGETAPQATVTLQVESPETIIKTTTSTVTGAWSHILDTGSLAEGSHTARAKAEASGGLLSSFSKVLGFYIGKYGSTQVCPSADFNKDRKTNLVDFSVMLYWWGKYNPCVDQNQNGIIDLPDFSILMYWWSG